MTFLDAAAVAITPAGPVSFRLPAPPSKSLTNRSLIIAALADGTSVLTNPLDSDDTRAMAAAMAVLGARVARSGTDVTVHGVGGDVRPNGGTVDAALSGTTLRFVAAAASLSPRPVTVTGRPPLLRRPIGPLTDALQTLGAQATDHGGLPPITVAGGLRGGHVTVDVAASSQFASALLMVAPFAEQDITLTARGGAADAYIAMTVDVMRRWGARVDELEPRRWHVSSGQGYRSRSEAVEYDASAAAHLLALAVATGGSATVTNAPAATVQPDAAIIDVFAAMGATVQITDHEHSVQGVPTVAAIDIDLAAMPDQVTTVAALAALAHGSTTIRGVAVTRGHETDRLAALANELPRLGVAVQEHGDGLTIRGGTASGPARLRTYHDHRLAMAFAAIAAAVPGVVIEDPGCVAKTYPGFWDDLLAAGVKVTAVI